MSGKVDAEPEKVSDVSGKVAARSGKVDAEPEKVADEPAKAADELG